MHRPCSKIHPVLQPETCESCAAYIAKVAGVGKGPNRLFGSAPAEKKPCEEPLGANPAKFLEKPPKLNDCKGGSGSDCSGSGSGQSGGCSKGDCGVAAVYCQGNILMVVYTSPFVMPTTTTTTVIPGTTTTTTTAWFSP